MAQVTFTECSDAAVCRLAGAHVEEAAHRALQVFGAEQRTRHLGGDRVGMGDTTRPPRRDDLFGGVVGARGPVRQPLHERAGGGIDIVVNNASVIDLSGSLDLAAKKYDLMQDINARGAFLLSSTAIRTCVPRITPTS